MSHPFGGVRSVECCYTRSMTTTRLPLLSDLADVQAPVNHDVLCDDFLVARLEDASTGECTVIDEAGHRHTLDATQIRLIEPLED